MAMNNYEKKGEVLRARNAFIMNVDLPAFLSEKLGYTVTPDHENPYKNGQRRYIARGVAGKFQIIPNDNKFPAKWSWIKPSEQVGGDIVKFLCMQHGYGDPKSAPVMQRIYYELSKFEPSNIFVTEPIARMDSFTKPAADLSVTPIHQNQYLTSRGLDTIFLKNPKYASAVFNKLTLSVTENGANFSFYNTAFPIKNQKNEAIGFQLHNKPIAGKMSKTFTEGMKKTEGVWLSSNRKPNMSLIIAESPVDAMSYTKLHPELLSNSNDMAFMGRMDREGVQMNVIKAHVAVLKPSNIILANDNDTAGLGYDIDLLCALKKEGDNRFEHISIKHQITHNANDRSTNYAGIVFEIKDDCPKLKENEATEMIKDISAKFGTVNWDEKCTSIMNGKSFAFNYLIDQGTRSRIVKLFVNDIYKDQAFFTVDKAKGGTKDWNEKLMETMGLSKSNFARNFNPYLNLDNDYANNKWLKDNATISLDIKKNVENVLKNAVEKEM